MLCLKTFAILAIFFRQYIGFSINISIESNISPRLFGSFDKDDAFREWIMSNPVNISKIQTKLKYKGDIGIIDRCEQEQQHTTAENEYD